MNNSLRGLRGKIIITVILAGWLCLYFSSLSYAGNPDKGSDVNTENPKAAEYYNRGLAASNNKEAIRYYNLALSKDPCFEAAILNLGAIYYEKKEYTLSEKIYLSAKGCRPESAEIAESLGKVYYVTEKYPEAIEQFEKTMRLAPGNKSPLKEIAKIKYKQKKYAECVDDIKSYLFYNINDSYAHYLCGRACKNLGDTECAITHLKQCVKLNRVNSDALFQLGDIYLDMKQYADAIFYLDSSLQLRGDDYVTAFNLAVAVSEENPQNYLVIIPIWMKFLEVAENNPDAKKSVSTAKIYLQNIKSQIGEQAYDSCARGAERSRAALWATAAKIKKEKLEKSTANNLPPDLVISDLKLVEPSGNNALDGGEKGKITFMITNRGRGTAYDVMCSAKSMVDSPLVSYSSNSILGNLKPGESRVQSIDIEADLDAIDQPRRFDIKVTEKNGFDADPAVLSFEILAYRAPDLRIEKVAIDDSKDAESEGFSYGNGNSIIEPGESIEVTAYVQNYGEGEANDVAAQVVFLTDDVNITYPGQDSLYKLGTIPSGDYKKIDFYFYTSRRYSDINLPIHIKLAELADNKPAIFAATIDLGLKMGEKTENIYEVEIAKNSPDAKPSIIKKIDELSHPVDVDVNIPESKVDGSNTLAVILGIREYKYSPDVVFADRDARVFYRYASKVLGIPENNIYYKLNSEATAAEFDKVFSKNGWIARHLKHDSTDIIVYYSGHGAPDHKSGRAYLIPSDVDPKYKPGVALDDIYYSLGAMKIKSSTFFIDACFSGVTRSGDLLIAGTRPGMIPIDNFTLPENTLVLTASSGVEYSHSYQEKKHGLFTYFLLKGLRGEAIARGSELSAGDLYKYIKENVTRMAGYLDKEQTPQILGVDRERVLIRF